MSIEAHPNVHAINVMLKTKDVVMEALRGEAETKKKEMEFFLLNETRKFAIHISQAIDDFVEGKK